MAFLSRGLPRIVDRGVVYEFRHADRVLLETRGNFFDGSLFEAKPPIAAEPSPASEAPLAPESNNILSQHLDFLLRPLKEVLVLGRLVFHADASELQRRYEIRDTTTDAERKTGQIWLELKPKGREGSTWKKIELVLTEHELDGAKVLLIYGVREHWRDDTTNTSHVFKNYQLNPKRTSDIDPFRVMPPRGWEHRIESWPRSS